VSEANQSIEAQSKSGAKDVLTMLACVVVILVLMAWFLTYDWPSGKRLSVGEFVLFWFRELIALAFAFIVLCALAIQKLKALGRKGAGNEP
jgi:hypothetical protein